MKILGIDPSLTSTGLAIVYGRTALVDRITTDATGLARLHAIVGRVRTWLDGCDLAVIEGPAYGSAGGQRGHHERAGLWWLLVDQLDTFAVPCAVVPPAARARYATGKGNASKDAVLSAVVRRYTDVDVDGNDQADALVLAAMGARRLGRPVEASLPVNNLDAMRGADWPNGLDA